MVSVAGLAKSAGNTPVLFWALLALLLWLPIPLGSNRPWYWALMEIWIFLMSAIWLVKYARGRAAITPALRKARGVLLLFAVWLGFGVVQMIPLPASLVKFLSPATAETYAKAASAPGLAGTPITPDAEGSAVFVLELDQVVALLTSEPLAEERSPRTEQPLTANQDSAHQASRTYRLTLDLHASVVAWLKSLAYVLLFVLVLLLVDSEKRLQMLIYALIFGGIAQAVYGALAVAFAGGGNATGTFVNRNHFAAYLVLCLALGIGLLIAWTGEQRANQSWRRRLRHLASLALSPKAPLRIFLALMVVVLVLTHSRMGNTAFFASMLITGVLALALFKGSNRSTIVLLSSLVIIDILIIGSYVGLERVRERLEQTSLETETRDEVDVYTWEIVKDYPLVGTGGGSYYGVFPRYRGADVGPLLYDHAHNDYLEFLSEYGALGSSLLGLIVVLALWNALVTARVRRHALMRGMAFAVIMAIVAMLIHASVEFNLQIPAYAATFVMMLAMAWLVRHLNAAQNEHSDTHHSHSTI